MPKVMIQILVLRNHILNSKVYFHLNWKLLNGKICKDSWARYLFLEVEKHLSDISISIYIYITIPIYSDIWIAHLPWTRTTWALSLTSHMVPQPFHEWSIILGTEPGVSIRQCWLCSPPTKKSGNKKPQEHYNALCTSFKIKHENRLLVHLGVSHYRWFTDF